MEMEKEIQILNIDDILPNRFQPRIQFNDKNINELADSIKEHGVIQPIVVRKIGDKYEIIAGERRYKASILANKKTIPAIVTNLDDKNSAEIALIENVQRQDLTPIEEAVSYKKILDMGYINQTDLAEKLGKTQSTIANKLRLLNLDDDVQEALLDGKISERHARSLLKLDKQNQINMLNRIISERLTVRQTDEEINKLTKQDSLPKESEEIKMDEKILNDFNIPTTPIMEEVKDTENINPITENHKENINPGFMDIDKIESNAEDIFKVEEPADMERILERPNVIEDINPMAPVMDINQNVNEEPKGTGKFFNMFNFGNQNDNPNFVSDIENKETNLNFGEPSNVPPAFNPFNVEPVITSEKTNEEVNSSLEKEEVNLNQNVDNQFNNFSNVEIEEIKEPSDDNLEEIPLEEKSFDSFSPYHLNDEIDFTTKLPIINEETINQEKINAETINQETNTSNDLETIDFNTEVEEIELPKENIETLKPNVSLEVPVNKYENDFKMAINTIRNCVETIEKYGYKISSEEIDLENSYEVILKIDKKEHN